MYTSDIGVGTEQLYAATVASSRAHAHISKIDLSDAEKVLNSRSHPCVAGMVACSLRMTEKFSVWKHTRRHSYMLSRALLVKSELYWPPATLPQ